MTISPAYVQPPPPLRWLRLPLLVATLGLSCVCVAVGAQALDRHVSFAVKYTSPTDCVVPPVHQIKQAGKKPYGTGA
jgi:hypothetical protein